MSAKPGNQKSTYYNVTCIEPSQKLAEKARARELNVYTMRFQDYPIVETFNAIIAISSFIHISRSEMPSQIET